MKALAAALLLAPAVAFAHPPPGTDLRGAEHAYWACFKNPKQYVTSHSCCSEADGHNIPAADWHDTGDPNFPYVVLIEGKEWKVPKSAVILPTCGPDPDKAHAWQAKAWFAPNREGDGRISSIVWYCFLPSGGM